MARKARLHYASQPRQIGIRRERRGTGLLKKINDRLQADADKYGVSTSWILALIAAEYYKIEGQPDYRTGK